jgi:hypothetical protein
MSTRPIITGVTFPGSLDQPATVVDNPDRPTTWGWFCNGMNVTRAESRAAAYATAFRLANRRRRPAHIYANTGDGWTQVDTVRPPEREVCEWWPASNEPATGLAGEGCGGPAELSVGVAKNWHLCGSCAGLPRFRRMARQGRLNIKGDDA